MKKILLMLSAAFLLTANVAEAKMELKANIWAGEQEFSSSWLECVQIASSDLPTFTAGDELRITVTAIGDASGWPQIAVRQYDWNEFTTSLSYGLWNETAPCVAAFTLTQETIDEIASSGGLLVFGASYTMTSIDLYSNVGESTTTTIYSGEKEFSADWSSYMQIAVSDLPALSAGDELLIEVSAIGDASGWPQISVRQYDWNEFTTSLSYGLWNETAPLTAKFTLTQDNIDEINSSGGILIFGSGYTLTEVSIRQAEQTEEGENINIWEGSTEMPSSWGSYVQLPAGKFINAMVGYLLRMSITDLKAGAQGHICTSAWGDMPDATEYVQLSGRYFQFTITEDMLAELQKNGAIVFGCNYTLTSVDLINPANLPNLSSTVAIGDTDWVWDDATPAFTVSVTNNGENETTPNVDVVLLTDKREAVATYQVSNAIAAAATDESEFKLADITAPGFYIAEVYAADELVKSFTIGYRPEEIVSAVDAQPDFSEFWQTALDELSAVEPAYTLTELTDMSTASRKVYLVEMQSLTNDGATPVTIRAYYAEPVAEGSYPCCIHYQGYDDGTSDLWTLSGDGHDGWCDLVVSTRGQSMNNRDPYKEENSFYGDWFAYNFGQKDHYYYRGAFADAVRAIDFVCSREKVDQRNIFAEGASQGGALTIAAAALDTRLCAIAPAIPFLGDFPDYFQVASWPASVALAQQSALNLSDADVYAFLSYFDTKNLAPRITCPVLECIGLQDTTCPPHTNIAPYNNLGSTDKTIIYNPTLGHTTASDWWNTMFNFFGQHLVSDGISAISGEASTATPKSYNIAGQRVGNGFKGLVIENGQKLIRK